MTLCLSDDQKKARRELLTTSADIANAEQVCVNHFLGVHALRRVSFRQVSAVFPPRDA
jgi:hypothetical protein